MNQKEADEIRQNVRKSYSAVAEASNTGDDCGNSSSCCGVASDEAIQMLVSTRMGYSEEDLSTVPEGADMGLGCGNPRAIAGIQKGETVLDLGSGGGFDCFLAAAETGETGKVIGIDMTPTMISKARENADKGQYTHVEFRLGEIENLPVGDSTIDVIISNCVINLSPDKVRVFSESFRALKTGGRLAISDVVASTELPESIRNDLHLYSGCMAGAIQITELQVILEEAGFVDICITPKDESKEFIKDWAPDKGVEDYVLSASIEAVKPVSRGCC